MDNCDLDEMKGTEEEEGIDADRTEFSTSPSGAETMFAEAVRKLNSYEHSLETLVKRFDDDGIQTDSEILLSEMAEELHSSDAFDIPGETSRVGADLSAGGDARRKLQTSNDIQKYVKIQIPFHTAEIILQILDEDLDKTQRTTLKQAEACLNSAKRSLVTVRKMLDSQLENSDASKRTILIKTKDIVDSMFPSIEKLSQKLLECQVENLSELLVIAMQDETKLSLLAKRPKTRNKKETRKMGISERLGGSTEFYAIIFFCVASYFFVRIMMLYMDRDAEVFDKMHLFIWQPFQEEMKQLFVNIESAFKSLFPNSF